MGEREKRWRGFVKTLAQICQNELPPNYVVDDIKLQERTEIAWEQSVAREWAADWDDPRENIEPCGWGVESSGAGPRVNVPARAGGHLHFEARRFNAGNGKSERICSRKR